MTCLASINDCVAEAALYVRVCGVTVILNHVWLLVFVDLFAWQESFISYDTCHGAFLACTSVVGI